MGVHMTTRKNGLLAGILAMSLILGGCSVGGREVVFTSGVSNRDVFKIGDYSCNLTEAKVYLANCQNIYGKSYGIDLWEQDFQAEKLKKYVKDVAMSEMTTIACMNLLAKEREISLTKEEKQDAADAASVYYASLSDAEKSYMGASEADIISMYEDYALAQKVYRSLTGEVDGEVSDDEARIMEAMQIYVKTQEKANEVAERLAAGEDFAAVASNYNQKKEIEITFGRGELPEEVEKIAFELDNEEISGKITVEEGVYFIKCINKFNEELTDANKDNIVEAREKAAFDDVYEEFISGLSSNLNEKVWNEIELITDGSITTDSFFEEIDSKIDG